jgi:hypothetical protein
MKKIGPEGSLVKVLEKLPYPTGTTERELLDPLHIHTRTHKKPCSA